MDRSRIENHLIQLFQEITAIGLQECNLNKVIEFLIEIIDNDTNQIYNNNLLYSFLTLLKTQPQSTMLINHLINEAELKGLRITWVNILKQEPQCSNCKPNNQNGNNTKSPNNFSDIKNFNASPLSKVAEGITAERDGEKFPRQNGPQRVPQNQQQRRPNN